MSFRTALIGLAALARAAVYANANETRLNAQESDRATPVADGKAYASLYTGKHSHRVLKGIGHDVPQEAPAAFAQAIIDVDGYSR